MGKYTIIYFGIWGYGKWGLKALLKCENIELIKVYTKWDNFKNDLKNQVYILSNNNNIPVVNSEKITLPKEEFTKSVLKNKKPDFIVSCCYDRIFNENILNFSKIISINVHPSILPKYRGIKPLENAIIKGEKNTGVTIHQLSKKLDAGDILMQDDKILIEDNKTYDELYNEQGLLIKKLLIEFFKNPYLFIKNPKKQNDNDVIFAPRLNLDFNMFDTVKIIREKFKMNGLKV